MKSQQIKIRVSQENAEMLRKLTDSTGLLQIELTTLIMNSALNAVREHQGVIPLKLRFNINQENQNDVYQLNEPPNKKRQ